MPQYRKLPPEYRDEPVLMMIQSPRPVVLWSRACWASMGQTWARWVDKYCRECQVTEEPSLPDRAKLKELELASARSGSCVDRITP